MRAKEIISSKISSGGHDVPRELLVKLALDRVDKGLDIVLRFGPVVFTVSREDPASVHLYSAGAGARMRDAFRRFHRAVWKRTDASALKALTRDRRLIRICSKFGWEVIGTNLFGCTVMALRRPV